MLSIRRIRRNTAWLFVYACIVALPATVRAQTQQPKPSVVDDDHSLLGDEPVQHPLAYFTTDALAHDAADDFCHGCTAVNSIDLPTPPSLHPIGKLAGFQIVEVDVQFRVVNDPPPNVFQAKSILVKTGADAYLQLYLISTFDFDDSKLSRARIVRSGSEKVLATMYLDGGTGGFCSEGYWWFDSHGPHPVDFSKVRNAIDQKIPPGADYSAGCRNLDLGKRTITSWVQSKDAPCQVCGGLGVVTATLRLNRWVAEPVKVKFKPHSG